MKILRFFFVVFVITNLTISWSLPKVSGQDYYSQDDQNKKILKQAVVGAGTGAIVAKTADGSAGKGALIGAGTNVIGTAVLDTLTGSSSSQPQRQPQQQQVVYVQETPQPIRYDVQDNYESGYDTSDRDYSPVEVNVETKRGGCGRN